MSLFDAVREYGTSALQSVQEEIKFLQETGEDVAQVLTPRSGGTTVPVGGSNTKSSPGEGLGGGPGLSNSSLINPNFGAVPGQTHGLDALNPLTAGNFQSTNSISNSPRNPLTGTTTGTTYLGPPAAAVANPLTGSQAQTLPSNPLAMLSKTSKMTASSHSASKPSSNPLLSKESISKSSAGGGSTPPTVSPRNNDLIGAQSSNPLTGMPVSGANLNQNQQAPGQNFNQNQITVSNHLSPNTVMSTSNLGTSPNQNPVLPQQQLQQTQETTTDALDLSKPLPPLPPLSTTDAMDLSKPLAPLPPLPDLYLYNSLTTFYISHY